MKFKTLCLLAHGMSFANTIFATPLPGPAQGNLLDSLGGLIHGILDDLVPEIVGEFEFRNEFGALEVIPPNDPDAFVPDPYALEKRDPIPQNSPAPAAAPDANCVNGPTTRQCWLQGYNIVTDFDLKSPNTGREVTYNLEIRNQSDLAPDGVNKQIYTVNGGAIGPTLQADWGDTLVINVKNSLQDNGTSIHWHGFRQFNSCQYDGVNGVTECPIPPGHNRTYRIHCTQHGTSWYHSHHSAQHGDGVVGGIIINGPATSQYDTDLGTFAMTDWYHEGIFAMNYRALHSPFGPPLADSALLNGTMKLPDGRGTYQVTKVTQGKRFRLRLINTGVDSVFHVSIDNHNFTVISADFVPVKPYVTSSVVLNIGQRHDIILYAGQAIGNYWLRADIGTDCAANAIAGSILAIIRYDGAPETDPTTNNTITKPTSCTDEPLAIPYVNSTVPSDQFDAAMRDLDLDGKSTTSNAGGSLVQWLINGTSMRVDWERPTLGNILSGNTDFLPTANLVEITVPDSAWTFWVIQTVPGAQLTAVHPVHLHGHDFYVLGKGTGVWNGDKSSLQFVNPPRRDTSVLPAGGYLVLAFPADNPGVWLMHCHIAFHVGQGLSLQFLERKSEIVAALGDMGDFQSTCDSWSQYWNSSARVYEMDDSGL